MTYHHKNSEILKKYTQQFKIKKIGQKILIKKEQKKIPKNSRQNFEESKKCQKIKAVF